MPVSENERRTFSLAEMSRSGRVSSEANERTSRLSVDVMYFLLVRGREESAGVISKIEPKTIGAGNTRRREVHLSTRLIRFLRHLGGRCLHCQERTEALEDFMLVIADGSVDEVLHETCFRKWFIEQDKAHWPGFNLAELEDGLIDPGSIQGAVYLDDLGQITATRTVSALRICEYAEVAASKERRGPSREVVEHQYKVAQRRSEAFGKFFTDVGIGCGVGATALLGVGVPVASAILVKTAVALGAASGSSFVAGRLLASQFSEEAEDVFGEHLTALDSDEGSSGGSTSSTQSEELKMEDDPQGTSVTPREGEA